jgi:hypothetical protein
MRWRRATSGDRGRQHEYPHGAHPAARCRDPRTLALRSTRKAARSRRWIVTRAIVALTTWPGQVAIEEARRCSRIGLRSSDHASVNDGYLAQAAGKASAAARAASGDWRLEVMARSNVADLLWQIGQPDDAPPKPPGLPTSCASGRRPMPTPANLPANLRHPEETGRIDDAKRGRPRGARIHAP